MNEAFNGSSESQSQTVDCMDDEVMEVHQNGNGNHDGCDVGNGESPDSNDVVTSSLCFIFVVNISFQFDRLLIF